MQPHLLHPHPQGGQHFLHLHLGGQGFGGHLRSGQGGGGQGLQSWQQYLHPHPQHPPAVNSAAAPSPKAAATIPSATGLKDSFAILVLLI